MVGMPYWMIYEEQLSYSKNAINSDKIDFEST